MYYKQLPSFLVRRLEERTIRCLRIDSTVDAQVKFDIFERLNTGSIKLEAQELRNATSRGPFNDLIKTIAGTPSFRALIQVDGANSEDSPKVRKMEDAELVLRFFSLRDGRYRTLKKGFKEFLTASQTEFNKLPGAVLKTWSSDFKTYMDFLSEHNGPTPFAKWRITDGTTKKMSSFNAAVFDAVAVGLSEVFSARRISSHPNDARDALAGFESLFKDDRFFAAVSGSVNDAAKVVLRIDAMIEFLRR